MRPIISLCAIILILAASVTTASTVIQLHQTAAVRLAAGSEQARAAANGHASSKNQLDMSSATNASVNSTNANAQPTGASSVQNSTTNQPLPPVSPATQTASSPTPTIACRALDSTDNSCYPGCNPCHFGGAMVMCPMAAGYETSDSLCYPICPETTSGSSVITCR